jgi:tetratricopeptide (TPR) repeat protein
MMKFQFSFIFLPLLLAACAHAPQHAAQGDDPEQHVMDMSVVLPAMSETATAPTYPRMELTEQLLYTFLMADIAAQRGRSDLAAEAFAKLARVTRDARIARRAAQLAYESQQMEQALELLKLWQELEPKAVMPKQMLVTVLMGGGKLEEARPYLSELLAADSKNAGHLFEQVYPLFGRYPDKLAVYKMLLELAKPYRKGAETHWVLAQAAEAASLHDEALRELRQVRALRPQWEWPVLLEVRILQVKTPEQALAVEKKFLDEYPDAKEVRLSYARLLLEQKQYQESRVQFQEMLKQQPENAEVAFAIALLSIQVGEFDRAEKELKQTLATGKKDGATVHYYLAQLHEAKKNEAAALEEYQQVKGGEYAFSARMRMAYLLNKVNKLNEAREVLHQTETRNNQQRSQLILTEGQILRDAKQYDAAFKVISAGLEKLPNQPELLYEAAMLADKQGKLVTVEEMLRRLIQVAPDYAHAYNALGYALLERNVRLEEAMELVEKAYQLDPEDAAIMDSMGWGYYLQGKLEKSLEFMRRAYATYPDPEVAAHLGEVLWKKGQKDEAKLTWQENLNKNPDSAALKAVMKKYLP